MTNDPESTLRPLRAAEGDLAALRGGTGGAAEVVRAARAAESTLRRLLRDDPTAPVELRLKALSPDDLPTDELLAVLRRRDRLPMELAAAFHELWIVSGRIAGGIEPVPRDTELAVSVAAGVERHVLSGPALPPMEDPVLSPPDETLLPGDPEDHGGAHPVPATGRAFNPVPVLGALAGIALIALLVFWIRGRSDERLERGEELLRKGETAQAAREFEAFADDHPEDPRPRVQLARIYREAGRLDLAAAALRPALQNAPDDPAARTEMGALLLESGRPRPAIDQFRRALGADSTSARAWGGLVRALRESGQPDVAAQALARAPAEVRTLFEARAAPAAIDPASMP